MEEKKTPKLANYKQGISKYFMLREAKDMRREFQTECDKETTEWKAKLFM